jgi:hypothetical protein
MSDGSEGRINWICDDRVFYNSHEKIIRIGGEAVIYAH